MKVLEIVLYSVKITSRVMNFFAWINDCQDWCLSCLRTIVTCLMLLVRWVGKLGAKPVSNIYISGSVFLFSFCPSFIFPSAKSKLNLFNLILLRNLISATACRALLLCWLLIMLLWECFSWALSVHRIISLNMVRQKTFLKKEKPLQSIVYLVVAYEMW